MYWLLLPRQSWFRPFFLRLINQQVFRETNLNNSMRDLTMTPKEKGDGYSSHDLAVQDVHGTAVLPDADPLVNPGINA